MKCKNEECDKDVRVYKNRKYNQCGRCAELKARYGITLTERNTLLRSQDNTCKICEKSITFNNINSHDRAVVDHEAGTKNIRGILCNHCNVAIGSLKHSEEIIKSALNYLRRTK